MVLHGNLGLISKVLYYVYTKIYIMIKNKPLSPLQGINWNLHIEAKLSWPIFCCHNRILRAGHFIKTFVDLSFLECEECDTGILASIRSWLYHTMAED